MHGVDWNVFLLQLLFGLATAVSVTCVFFAIWNACETKHKNSFELAALYNGSCWIHNTSEMGTASKNQADAVQARSKDMKTTSEIQGHNFKLLLTHAYYIILFFIYVYVRFYFYRAVSQIGDLKKKTWNWKHERIRKQYDSFPSEEMLKQSW